MSHNRDPYNSRWRADNRESRRNGTGISPWEQNSDRDRDQGGGREGHDISSPRDRRRESDRGKQPDKAPRDAQVRPSQSRQDSNAARSRQEHSSSSAPNAATSGANTRSEKRDADRTPTELLRIKDDVLRDLHRYRDKLENLDKVMAQKDKDFKNSSSKHSEYPSIVEMHKKTQDANVEQRVRTKKMLAKIEARYFEILNCIAPLLGAPQAEQDGQNSTIKQDTVLDANIVALQERLAKQESLLEEQQSKQEEQFKALLKAQEEKQEARFMALLKAREDKFQERAQSLVQKQDEWQEERSKDLENRLAAFLEENRQQMPSEELATLRKANESLKAELSAQQKDSADKVNDLNRKLAEALESIGALRSSVQSVEGDIQDHRAALDDHEAKFDQVDFENLDGIADDWAIRFPALKAASDTHRAEIDTLKRELEPLQSLKLEYTNLKEAQDNIINAVGGQLDAIMKQGDAHQARLNALEDHPAQTSSLDTLREQNESLAARLGALENGRQNVTVPTQAHPAPDAADTSVKSEVDHLKAGLDSLREVSENRYQSLMHITSSMQTQYDNLSSVELAHHIINVMEKEINPNTRQLSQDLEVAKSQWTGYSSRLGDVEQRIAGNETKLVDLFRDLGEMIARETITRPYLDDDRPSKRQRIEALNGHQLVENGRPQT